MLIPKLPYLDLPRPTLIQDPPQYLEAHRKRIIYTFTVKLRVYTIEIYHYHVPIHIIIETDVKDHLTHTKHPANNILVHRLHYYEYI